MSRPFLTAKWSNLCIITYAVQPELIRLKIPAWLEPDTRNGKAFVSLVAFEFLQTRVWGVNWPGFRDFPELNLRIYVKNGDKRGVYFVREFVPQRLVAWLARTLYNEPYKAARLTAQIRNVKQSVEAEYGLSYQDRTHLVSIRGHSASLRPLEDSEEHFFKEHRWGFGTTHSGKPLLYEVEHPVWDVYPVESVSVSLDWGQVYGAGWSFLQSAQPCSTVFALGSQISVYPAQSFIPLSSAR